LEQIVPERPKWKTPFFTIWVGQAFSLLGSQVVQFALVWWLTRSTGSATVLATATLVALLPGILLGPFAGACVDRWNRRLVMMAADGIIALATLGLGIIAAMGALRPWHVYIIMMLRALGGTFHWPAMQASISLMAPKEQLSRVAGLNQTLGGMLNIVAPPLGALLMSILPLWGVMLIDVGTAVLAIAPLVWVHIPQPSRSTAATGEAGKSSLWQDVREGLRYVLAWPGLRLIGVMATLLNLLLAPAASLLPILVMKHLGGGALQLGWMESAWGLGVVSGGLILSAWGGFRRRILTSLMGVIGMGLGGLLIGLTPADVLWPALVGMFLVGAMVPIANGPLFAMVQATVAPDMQGRMLTLMNSAAAAASPIGLAIAGPVADLLGVTSWYLVGGVACLLMGIGGFFVPTVVHLEDARPPRAVGEQARASDALADGDSD
jgi:DHA3 family macrolide efflux protein-like MFS transporter